MRRLVTSLTIISMLLATLIGASWIASYFVDIHVGRFTSWVALDGSVYDERSGLFVGFGQIAWSGGMADDDLDTSVLTLRPEHPPRIGVYVGNFWYWYAAKDNVFLLGFGHNGRTPAVSIPHWFFLLVLLTLPTWRLAASRYHWDQQRLLVTATSTYVAWSVLAVVGVIAPVLLMIILAYTGVFILLPASIVATRMWEIRRFRRRAGRCRVCGYDLRATPDPAGPLLERCPECGTYTQPLVR